MQKIAKFVFFKFKVEIDEEFSSKIFRIDREIDRWREKIKTLFRNAYVNSVKWQIKRIIMRDFILMKKNK